MSGGPRAQSLRSAQRHFVRATGLTHCRVRQIERGALAKLRYEAVGPKPVLAGFEGHLAAAGGSIVGACHDEQNILARALRAAPILER